MRRMTCFLTVLTFVFVTAATASADARKLRLNFEDDAMDLTLRDGKDLLVCVVAVFHLRSSMRASQSDSTESCFSILLALQGRTPAEKLTAVLPPPHAA